jgi:uncharacterized membrane protein YfcA
MWTSETLLIVGGTFLLAGFVKGVIGLGVPTVSLALLTVTLGMKPAMALLLLPSLVTNLWQAFAGGAFLAIVRRTWSLLLAMCLAAWVGVHLLTRADTALLSGLLGALLCVYAALGLARPQIPAPGRHETWLSPLVGVVNGVLTGLTGSFVVPGVPYLQSLGLGRDALVQAMGIMFTVSTLALAVSLSGQSLLPGDLWLLSLAAVLPALLGMVLGQVFRQLLSEAVFRRVFFISLVILGLYIAASALAKA